MFPALLLCALEVGLRLAGYGFATNLFKPKRISGQDLLVENDAFSYRFFAPEVARMVGPIRMAAIKPPGLYRIFVLGESAAMGDPEPAYGAARYLEILLRERFPAQRFEVVNVAFTAINSHVILPIARECAQQQGDLWIIYMGNNEMVGPFGAATVFGAQAPPLELVRLNLALRKTRVGQLLVALRQKLKTKGSAPSWGGMQMFSGNRVLPGDPRRDTVYRSFRRNLQDIVETGVEAGARIILSTVAVNLRDCPPFASATSSNLPPTEREQLTRLTSEGSAYVAQGDWLEASRRFEGAARLDPTSAELQFHWGECLLHLKRPGPAREHLQAACDLDTLPFRADSTINQSIRELGGTMAEQGVVFCDVADRLEQEVKRMIDGATNSVTGAYPLGQETFYEHVHFNFDGNYRLARIWASEVERLLPATVTRHPANDWSTQAACERWLGLTDWNRSQVIESVLQRMRQPPLSEQANNAERQAALKAWKGTLGLHPANAANARSIYEEAISRAPDDYCLHEAFGDFLVATHDYPQALVEWRRARDLLPDDYVANYRLAGVLAHQGQWAAAEDALCRAVTRRPLLYDAWYELGGVRAAEGQLEKALTAYASARRLRPESAEVCLNEGKVLLRLKRHGEALDKFREAIRLNPADWKARDALGGQLGLGGDIGAARSEFEQVVRLKPEYARGHLNLGVALLKQGQASQAAKEFQEAVRLDPSNAIARDYLRQAQLAASAKP